MQLWTPGVGVGVEVSLNALGGDGGWGLSLVRRGGSSLLDAAEALSCPSSGALARGSQPP